MSGNSSKLIAYNYFGGKFSHLDNLYSAFPQNFTHLIDLFGGSFVVSMNYTGNVIRTANEINGEITNFFKVLRDHEHELLAKLELTPVSELEYENCFYLTDDAIENARRFYVRMRQSFYSTGANGRNKGFSMAKSAINAVGGETVSRFNNGVNKLRDVAAAIRKNFQITNKSYSDCIDIIDFEKAFFYADPPYPKESRASFNDYKFEFTDHDHEALSLKLHGIKGLDMVSGYYCELMNDLYGDWYLTRFPIKQNNIRSSDVQECVWTNYKPAKRQLNLF